MGKLALAIGAIGLATIAVPASAATINVDALANSITGGVGATFGVSAGQSYNYSSDINDLWSAGALPRWSDANGLSLNGRVAVAGDDSGEAPGTVIGGDFGTVTIDGFTAPFGALVGRLNGAYTFLGLSGVFNAGTTGTLELFYWDGFSSDNSGSIAVSITSAVPEPAAWALMIGGFGLAGAALRRRRAKVALA